MIFTYLKIKGWSDQKVDYYGHTRSWSILGSAFSALMAAVIVFSYQDYQTVFLFSTVPYILDLALLATYPKVLDGTPKKHSFQQISTGFRTLFHTFFKAFQNAKTLKLANSVSIYSGFYKAAKDYLQPIIQTLAISLPFLMHLEDTQRTALLTGQVYFFIYLISAIASRNAAWVAGHFQHMARPLNLSLAIGLFSGIFIGLFFFIGWFAIAIIIYLGIYLMEHLRKPMGIGLFADHVEDQIWATALSAQSQMRTLWGAVIAVLLGTLVDLMGVGAALGLTSLALLLLVPMFWLEED